MRVAIAIPDIPRKQENQEIEILYFIEGQVVGCTSTFMDIDEWLASFNTDSATECFTAIQRLKAEE